MPYDFFFSYTRGNSGEYLKQFFNDLSQELREQRGCGKDEVVGFFDQGDIELGEDWQNTIATALQESKVMVCIYSPGYFKSSYCGKEWEIFHKRREEYVRIRKSAGAINPALPPVIKPIFWMAPLPVGLDEAVNATQYIAGNPAEEHNKRGLKYVLQKLSDYKSMYVDYIRDLAAEIREAADTYDLPIINRLPSLSEIKTRFPIGIVSQQLHDQINTRVENQQKVVQEQKHVRFVFVAADPNEFGNLRAKDSYLDVGGRDWRPFPGMGRIGPFVQNLVSSEELDFVSDELSLSDKLMDDIEEAYAERKIIIFLVDGWTINWKQEYQDILKKFDQENRPFINCSVLVPCNESDPDYIRQKDGIDQTIQSTFDFRANLWRNPNFYRDKIRSKEELREVIREVLINIKAEMHKRAQVVKEIQVQFSKPIVSNQIINK